MFQIKWLSIFLFIFSILAVLPSAASAQQPLTYGDTANGSLSAAAPVQIYTFNGETGDFITVQVITLSPGLQPTLSVIRPNGQPLTTDVLTLGSLSQHNGQLSSNGVHTVIITSGAGGLGDFALTLSGKPASAAVEVGENGGEFALAGEQLFMIPPAATARQLTVQTTPSAPFTVTLHGGDAGTVVLQSSGNADAVTFILPESTAGYRLTIVSTGTGNITVNLILTDAETVSTGAPSSAGSTDTLPVDADCVGMPNSGVNVRTGPGTDYAVISAIPTRTSVAVLGINANGGWYYVQLPNGRQGWILGVIMTIEGECEGLPTIPVSADARMAEMTETLTMTFTPTATVNTSVTPTATMNTSVTPTPTATMNTSVTPTATMNTSVTPTPTATTDEMSTATYTPSFTPTGTENVSTATYTPSFTPTTSE